MVDGMGLRICLIHWKKLDEATARAQAFADAGMRVDIITEYTVLRTLRDEPIDAYVVSMDRLPSQGKEAAIGIRSSRKTRHVPLVVVGAQKRRSGIEAIFADAVYADWDDAVCAVENAVANPPADPIVFRQAAQPSKTPLWKKLGIKGSTVVGLFEAPPDFEDALRGTPDGTTLTRAPDLACDVTLWFVRSRDELDAQIGGMSAFARRGKPFWIAWPKKSSGMKSDLSDSIVRETGLAAGLVDYKVCAIDATWSGYCFAPSRTSTSSESPENTNG